MKDREINRRYYERKKSKKAQRRSGRNHQPPWMEYRAFFAFLLSLTIISATFFALPNVSLVKAEEVESVEDIVDDMEQNPVEEESEREEQDERIDDNKADDESQYADESTTDAEESTEGGEVSTVTGEANTEESTTEEATEMTEGTTEEAVVEEPLVALGQVPTFYNVRAAIQDDEIADEVQILNSDRSEVDKDNGTMSLGDSYYVKYKLKSPLSMDGDVNTVEKNHTYYLSSLPKEIKYTGDLSFDAMLSNGAEKLGTINLVSIGSNQGYVVTIEFGEDVMWEVVSGAYVEIGVQLNEAGLEPGAAQQIEFTNPDATYNISVTERVPKAPTITKTGEYQTADNTYLWTVTMTNAAAPIDYTGYTFTLEDTLAKSGKKHIYIDGSFKVNGTVPSDIDTNFRDFSNTTGKLVYEFTPDSTANKETIFTYKTQLAPDAWVVNNQVSNDEMSVTVENAAIISDGTTEIGSAEAKIGPIKVQREWMTKEGTDLGGGKTEWRIEVDCNGYAFTDVVVYDQFATTSNGYKLSLVADSVVYKDVTAPAGAVSVSSGTNAGKAYDWSYTIGDLSPANSPYVITYRTELTNYSDFIKTNQELPKNQAWLSFKWDFKDGNAPYEIGFPGITKNAPMSNTVIAKATGTYEPSTHEITWKVVVNDNKLPLENVIVKDFIQEGQEYVTDSFTLTSDASTTPTSTSLISNDGDNGGRNTLSVDFGNQLKVDASTGRTATFTMKTRLLEAEGKYFATNATEKTGKTYKNVVSLYANNLSDAIDSATAYAVATGEVLDKKDGTYDYATHCATWEIDVNKSKMQLRDICITDTLPTGFTLAENGVKVDSSVIPAGTSGDAKPYYTYNNGQVVIYLADIPSTQCGQDVAYKKIRLQAQVADVDRHTQLGLVNGTFTISNNVSMTTYENPSAVTDSGEVEINNKILTKTGAINKTNNVVTYTVNMNQAQATIPANMQVTDTLSKGMMLDITSVKVYKAGINSVTGAFTRGSEESGYQTSSKMNSNEETILTITMPNKSNNKQAYIITYDAMIVDTTQSSYTNNIQAGIGSGVQSANKNFQNSDINTSGGVTESLSRIILTNLNEEGEPLAGAVFSLKLDEQVVSQKTTDDEGKATFVGLSVGREYVIEEVMAPTGYAIGADATWRFIAPQGGRANALTHTFVNPVKTESIVSPSQSGDNSSQSDDDDDDSGNGIRMRLGMGNPNADMEGLEQGVTASDTLLTEEQVQIYAIAQELQDILQEPESAERQEMISGIRDRMLEKLVNGKTSYDDLPEETRIIVDHLVALGVLSKNEWLQRLPQTGGFWGSGIMYGIGIILILTGIGFVIFSKRSKNTE